MRPTLITLASALALAAAAPAAAQTVASAANIQWRINQIQTDIQAGVQAGTLTRVEAQTLRERLRLLRQTERQYAANGLTLAERRTLQSRIATLRSEVQIASRDSDIRYGQRDRMDANRDGYDDRDTDRDGRWEDNVDSRYADTTRIDANRDGYDDRDYDRDGRWDDDVRDRDYAQNDWIDRNRDGYDDRDYDRDGRSDGDTYAQGGPYNADDSCAFQRDRGGVAGAIDNVLGRDRCYTVGQRVSGRLDAVPSRHRDRFRDSSSVYYGYGDDRVYEVDTRTNVIRRVYRVD